MHSPYMLRNVKGVEDLVLTNKHKGNYKCYAPRLFLEGKDA